MAVVTLARPLLLWCLFFLVCLGLGYPTLKCYDPASAPGLSDSADYFRMSTGHADQVRPKTPCFCRSSRSD